MANEPGNPTIAETPPPSPAAVAPSPAASVPEDYEELKAFRATYEPVLNQIAPHWSDIEPIVTDDQEREYWKAAREARQRQLEAQKPQLTPELKLIRDEFAGELGPLVEYVKSERQAKEQAAQAAQSSQLNTNLEYAKRLVAEHPELGEHNYAGINAFAQLAYRDGSSLEEAYKRYSGVFTGPAPKREPPPSLRAGAAAPGIPGESTQPKARTKNDLRARLLANMKASR